MDEFVEIVEGLYPKSVHCIYWGYGLTVPPESREQIVALGKAMGLTVALDHNGMGYVHR